MTHERLTYLLHQFAGKRIAETERRELKQFLDGLEATALPEALISPLLQEDPSLTADYLSKEAVEAVLQSVLALDKRSLQPGEFGEAASPSGLIPPVQRIHFLRTAWFRYAAVVLLLVGTGAYLWFQNSREQTLTNTYKPLPQDIEPGKEGAILTLADGSQVVLDSLGNGVIATQNGTQVLLQNGQLAYDPTGKGSEAMMYNTMTTPKGRQFNVVLPDGTKVWLNAASSLRYPTQFSGGERRVEITGEAYFEVAKDKSKPFFVKINDGAVVEVLGTSFNVNAYKDEVSINTTLLEGSIAVAESSDWQQKGGQATVLKPGQQAQVLVGQKTQPGITVVNADIDKVMAWKNGAFNFNNASLKDAMKQLERWYDIEVVYEKGIPDIHFVGEMSRGVSLAGLTRTLEKTGVRFRIEGRKLVVLP